jgi:hypothetical protein
MADGLHIDFVQMLLSEYDDDKHLGVNVDHYGDGDAGGQSAEVICGLGTLARPVDPETANDGSPDVASEAMLFTQGDRLLAMPINDPRTMPRLPPLKKGGFIAYCPAAPGSFWLWDGKRDDGKKAGTFTLSTKYAKDAKAHLLTLDVRSDDDAAVMLLHGQGMGLTMTAGGKNSAVLRNAGGNAYVETNDDGLVLVGKTKIQGSVTVGQMVAADSLVKEKSLAAWAAGIEAALAGLGRTVVPFAAFNAGTSHLKGS